MEHSRWSGKTDGSRWMQESLVTLFRRCDIRIFYGIMGFVILFYMAFNRRGYLSMYGFFRRRFGYSPLKSFCKVYRNHFAFGQIILDRFAVYAGKKFDVTIDGQEVFEQLLEGESPFVMLSSHVGNYELAGYSLHSTKKRVYALVFDGETETVMENRNRIFREHNIQMIPVKADMSHLFTINKALSEGDIVSMPADRLFGSQKSVTCEFLGAEAKFPVGPFAVAVQREAPVLSVFVMKESTKSYRIYVRRIDVPQTGSSVEKRQAIAREYVAELERVIRKYPTQWFNYYDFWA